MKVKNLKLFLFIFFVSPLFSFSLAARDRISKDELRKNIESKIKSFPYLQDTKLPLSFDQAIEPNSPVYKSIAKRINCDSNSVPQPESLCNEEFYWMGGETYTVGSNETAMVGGAGGNLYFATTSDPMHPLEMWWGDIPLRITIHNNYAYVFSYFYTYQFDVTDPLSPVFYSYGPGYARGYLDFYPTIDDRYLILTD